MNHKKSRVMDFFRRIDKDQDGKITRQEFIDGILASSEFTHSCKHGSHPDSLHLVKACDILASLSEVKAVVLRKK